MKQNINMIKNDDDFEVKFHKDVEAVRLMHGTSLFGCVYRVHVLGYKTPVQLFTSKMCSESLLQKPVTCDEH